MLTDNEALDLYDEDFSTRRLEETDSDRFLDNLDRARDMNAYLEKGY